MAKSVGLQTTANKRSLDGCVKYIKYEKIEEIKPGSRLYTPKVTLELFPEYKDEFYDALTKGELPFISNLLANYRYTIESKSNELKLKLSQGVGDIGAYIFVSSNPELQHLPFFESENLAFAFTSPADKKAFIKLTCLKEGMYLPDVNFAQNSSIYLQRTCINPRTDLTTLLLMPEEELYFKQVKELAEQQVAVCDNHRIIDKLRDISVVIKMANIINFTDKYKALLSNPDFIANLKEELERVNELGYPNFKYTIKQDKVLIQPFTLAYRTKEGDVGFKFISNERAEVVHKALSEIPEFDKMAAKIEIKGNEITIKKTQYNPDNGVFKGAGALGISTPSESFRDAFEKALSLAVALKSSNKTAFNDITDVFHHKKLDSLYFCSSLDTKKVVFGDYYKFLNAQQQAHSPEILALIGENIEYNDDF